MTPRLFVVTGWKKGSEWAVAAISQSSVSGNAHLLLKTAGLGSVEAGYQWENAQDLPAITKEGPYPPGRQKNQTLFIKGFWIEWSEIYIRRVAFGPSITQYGMSKLHNNFPGKQTERRPSSNDTLTSRKNIGVPLSQDIPPSVQVPSSHDRNVSIRKFPIDQVNHSLPLDVGSQLTHI